MLLYGGCSYENKPRLFPSWSIGFDRIFDLLESASLNAENWLPYNIAKPARMRTASPSSRRVSPRTN
jgi:molecular chaperone IbpA